MFDALRRLFARGAARRGPGLIPQGPIRRSPTRAPPRRSKAWTDAAVPHGRQTVLVDTALTSDRVGRPATFADVKGFLPGLHALEGYGNGGFQFADMSHRGSILVLPSGIYAWDAATPDDLALDAFGRVLAEPKGAIEHLLIGTGTRMLPLFALREALGRAGIRAEPMATDAAARTYSILLGEKRRVAAALLAVP